MNKGTERDDLSFDASLFWHLIKANFSLGKYIYSLYINFSHKMIHVHPSYYTPSAKGFWTLIAIRVKLDGIY